MMTSNWFSSKNRSLRSKMWTCSKRLLQVNWHLRLPILVRRKPPQIWNLLRLKSTKSTLINFIRMMMMTLASNKNQKVWSNSRGMSLFKNHKKVMENFQIAIKNQTSKNQNLKSTLKATKMNLIQSLSLIWWRNLHRPQIHIVRSVNSNPQRGTVHPKLKSHSNLNKY